MGRAIKTTLLITALMLVLSGCQTSTPPTQTPPAVTSTASQPETAQLTTNTSQPAPSPPVVEPSAPTIPIGVSVGNLAPDFNLKTLTGENVTLSSLRGKPVLLNFWATWCDPCKKEMPYLQQINDSYSSKGLVLLAVDWKDKAFDVEKFMMAFNLSMTVPMDTNGKVTQAYLVGAIPTTFLIDKDGVIRQKKIGPFADAADIENELKKIMP